MAKTSGLSATETGTVFPPTTPARISWNMSAAYSLAHEGHSEARRSPHRTQVTPNGSPALEYSPTTSPLVMSIVWQDPTSRIGLEQFPTLASASDQPSKSGDPMNSATCRCA